MNFKKQLFFLVSFLLISVHAVSSQEDKIGKKKVITIKAKTKPVKKTGSLNFDTTKGFQNAHKNTKKTQAQKDAELKRKGIITPEMLRKQKFKKNMEKHNLKIPMIDRDLGAFKTKSKHIHISSFDFGQEDGDVVSIYINNQLIVKKYKLTNAKKIFTFELKTGFTQIEIKAIDEGRLRPNTGSFSIYDDQNNTVISDYWNLAKGAIIKALIIKE